MKTLASDNYSGVHPKILQAIIDCNKKHAFPYGDDYYTKKAVEKFKEIFGEKIDVYFVSNGTAANVISLSSVLRSFESVICTDIAHITVDECGALERFTGSKILQLPHKDGKICIDDIKKTLNNRGVDRHTQPKIISISQVTEIGTVYTIDEIKNLVEFAHKNDLLVHIDGARISNAAVALDVSFKEMITDTGVDLLSFGGTKNGMMYGEAIISFNPKLSENLKYLRKQGMNVISKMRYISAQFLAFFENELWKENAKNSNAMAKLLATELQTIPDIKLLSPIESNIIFARIPEKWIKPLQSKYYFYKSEDESNLVRWVTSYDTTKEEILDFVNQIKQLRTK
ncbi:threonine aldolase family protein [Tepidibacter thalassicus]|uniref:L-threonine aldolase n=1 Tax=Tepidibacter thalassicus DSM 15285 TaxID=1123350 RepID=A0A1M5SPY1_9FIRM|nr:low specificity L-threonine aldolase [Tepidibacter thalassicus]SHH40535.1 L-threonine aldolase [Tepidibacter thalassicus DSM 15285]